MPRPLFLGNRRLHVNIDDHYSVRDLYWPNVGFPNHLSGHKVRLGIWCDNTFSWLDRTGWVRNLGFSSSSTSTHSTLTHAHLLVELTIQETILADRDLWIRRIRVRNLADHAREFRLFESHDLRINESDIGDCAFFEPVFGGLVHYKQGVWIGFAGCVEGPAGFEPIDQYSCGVKAWAGMEGTWRDAEDGVLEGKPIEQGSVDSTMRLTCHVAGGGIRDLWIVVGASDSKTGLDEVLANIHSVTLSSTFEPASSDTDQIHSVSERVIHTHMLQNGGLVAATDSDIMETARASYGYVWLRDAALTLETWGRLGHFDDIRRTLDFVTRCETLAPGVFAQKYNVNGTIGAGWHPRIWNGKPCLPIQADEIALIATLGMNHGTLDKDPWVREAVEFLSGYVDSNGLPLPSWDLWEERRGIHLWTTSCTIECLNLAATTFRSSRYKKAAEAMLQATLDAFFEPNSGFVARTIHSHDLTGYTRDPICDSSILLALMRSPFHAHLDKLARAVAQVERSLLIHSPIGGVARYEADYYFRRHDHHAGNPWVICTLWYARALHQLGRTEEAHARLDWVRQRESETGTLAEQYEPETGQALSVEPLVWSHAEYLETLLVFSHG